MQNPQTQLKIILRVSHLLSFQETHEKYLVDVSPRSPDQLVTNLRLTDRDTLITFCLLFKLLVTMRASANPRADISLRLPLVIMWRVVKEKDFKDVGLQATY